LGQIDGGGNHSIPDVQRYGGRRQFLAVDEPDLYVWIRRFENEEEAERLYKEVYESEYWRTEIKPQADEMLDRERMRITRLEATEKSVIR